MLISIQSWYVIYQITAKKIAIQHSLVHKDVPIGIHNIPLLRIFSNVAVNKLNAGRPLVLNFIHTFMQAVSHNGRSGVKAETIPIKLGLLRYHMSRLAQLQR